MSCPKCALGAAQECGGCPSRAAGDWLRELADELRYGSARPDSDVQKQAAAALDLLARSVDHAEEAEGGLRDAAGVIADLLAARVDMELR